MSWIEVLSKSDAEELTRKFGSFHDGCLREVHVWTETSVSPNLSMSCPPHLDTHIRILFQRQFAGPSAIELQFDEVVGFQLTPTPDNYCSNIFDAQVTLEEGCLYWREDEGNWIGGKKLKWRDASEWMGDQLRYRSV